MEAGATPRSNDMRILDESIVILLVGCAVVLVCALLARMLI